MLFVYVAYSLFLFQISFRYNREGPEVMVVFYAYFLNIRALNALKIAIYPDPLPIFKGNGSGYIVILTACGSNVF